jgi:peptidoglycan/LPS O-acetylase OafA/YrhL
MKQHPPATSVTVPEPRAQLRGLTSLRFFAATIVVVFHCGQDALRSRWTGDFFQNGYEAVSFFFVLSGFVLTYVYAANPARPLAKWRFWLARAARICPIYWIALLICLPRLWYSTFHTHEIPLARFFGAVVATPLLVQAWIPPIATTWNEPAWSLSVEAFFYLLFPWLIARFRSVSTMNLLIGAASATIIVGAARTFADLQLAEASKPVTNFIRYFPLLHLPQFVVGIGIARLFLETSRISAITAEIVFLGGCLGLGGCFWARSSLPILFHSDALLVPLYAMMVYGAAEAAGVTGRALAHKGLLLLGEISYGVYILHVPLFFLWVRGIHFVTHNDALPNWTFWSFLASLLLISFFLYRKVEMPCRLAVKRWPNTL